MELFEKGVMTTQLLKEKSSYPSEERFLKGPVAICECVENIPCNPCESACRFGAITIGQKIADTPKLHEEKCTGCGLCIAACPGLAIFVLNKSYSDEVGSVSFPFEYLPLPHVGDEVDAVDRSGETICKGKIKKIATTKQSDRTKVITLEVHKAFVDEVRGIKRCRKVATCGNDNCERGFYSMSDKLNDDIVVCRCEEITVGEIKEAIHLGARDVTGVKRRTRAGMGLCQGRTCEALVQQILRQELGIAADEAGVSTPRTPQRPVTFNTLGDGKI